MVDVDAKHALEVTAVEEQQQVQTLGTYGPDKTLRDRVCLRRPHGSLQCPDAFAAEDLVEAAAAVGEEEQRVVAAQEHALDREEVARDDARSLRSQELAPTRAAAPRRRLQPRVSEQPADA